MDTQLKTMAEQLQEALSQNASEDGYTNEELAEAMGCSRHTMRDRRRKLEKAGVLIYCGDKRVQGYGSRWHRVPAFKLAVAS